MKPALAIFAKAPVPGQVKTRLTPPLSPAEAAALYRCMLLDIVARVDGLGIDTFIFYDGDKSVFPGPISPARLVPQVGDDLGARLENAFSALGERGYDARAVIGSDAPDLPLSFIKDAFKLLESGRQVVFGPAMDGGYYLVGLNGHHGELFRDIAWSTSDVLETSRRKSEAAGLATALLPTWYDVDDIDDLYRLGVSDYLSEAPLTGDFLKRLGVPTFHRVGATAP